MMEAHVVKYLFVAFWFGLACVCLLLAWRIDIASFDELAVVTGTVVEVTPSRRGVWHELIRLQEPPVTFRTDFQRAGIVRSIVPRNEVTLWVRGNLDLDATEDVERVSGVIYQAEKSGNRLLAYERVMRTQQFLRVIFSMGTVLFLGLSSYFGRNLKVQV